MKYYWKEAKAKRVIQVVSSSSSVSTALVKWKKPEDGVLKLNVDVAVRLGEASFSLGLVLRDSAGAFVISKTICKAMVATVIEAEASVILEGLKWLLTLNHEMLIIESESLLAVRALQDPQENLLEVGHILIVCKLILYSNSDYSVFFVKRQVSGITHLVAKLRVL